MGKGSGGGGRTVQYHLKGGHASLPEPIRTTRVRAPQTDDDLLHRPSSRGSSPRSNPLQQRSKAIVTPLSSSIPKGLLNVGNSCYANAVLQCLLSTALTHALTDPKASAIFRRYSSNPRLLEQGSGSVDETDTASCLSRERRITPRHDSRALQENCSWLTRELTAITLEYQELAPQQTSPHYSSPSRRDTLKHSWWLQTLAFLREQETVVLDPGRITKHPHRLSQCLRPYQQEDAHEFLRALLSTLVMHGQNKQLSSLFDGLLESAVTCLSCRKPSLTRDRYMDLSLDIANASILTLTDALQEFTATETLSGDNRVYCSQCECKRIASKGLRLATAPSILVVHLKRFALDPYGRLVRLSKLVDFPLRLEIGDYMSRVNKARPPPYELVAVLVHQGRSCESGHYVAFTRHSGQWYKCNDSVVERVDVETVLRQQAYILVYEVEEMRSKHGYSSPSGKSNRKVCGEGSARESTSPDDDGARADFMKLLSSSMCGLDEIIMQDFCWDMSNGMCQREPSVASTRLAEQRQRRRRRREESYRASDVSIDPHDDLSTLGESTVDTSDTSKIPFRRSCSSGNLKQMGRARDKISHSTGRSSQRFFSPDDDRLGQKETGTALLPDYKTAKRWAQVRKAAAQVKGTSSHRLENAGATPRHLPPRPSSAFSTQRQIPPVNDDESDMGISDIGNEGDEDEINHEATT